MKQRNFILEADNANITATTVIDTIDDVEEEYTEISIPIPNTNTEELKTWIASDKKQVRAGWRISGF